MLFKKKFINDEIEECENYVNKLHKRIFFLYDKIENCSSEDEIEKHNIEIDEILRKIDVFNENVYSVAVFKRGVELQPIIVSIYKKEKYKWKEFFGDDYNKLTKSKKYILHTLPYASGGYKIK